MKNISADIDLSNADDETLLHEIEKGNKPAHDEMYRRFFRFLKIEAYCQLEDIDNAENVVQDVFMEILEKPRIRHGIQLKRHLFNKVVRRCQSILKQNGKVSYQDTSAIGLYHDPNEDYDRKDVQKKFDCAIKHISITSREAFRLRWKENKSHKEIAIALNLSVDAAKKRISRGKKEFFNYLRAYRIYPI
ncbi:hypothetical protein GFS24_28120 [Chitinophaga sp. SYP-B3965]|uniref:RNA polymerase sigma factor n=1 Tax=Chitinophaga sp. SYP-B3965 TaxID=2663120 RepID=UPI0012997E2E|nr:sigma-70 family RNA polymerase sigma factor [Chitinophaga sp. SYP-B3965]MRG49008.1 hypothetical protein [Chitinophaga sp. SYP-B3965]